MMSSIGSSWTGQTSRHAPQVVQAQAASGESAKVSRGLGLGCAVLERWLGASEVVELHALVDFERGGA